MWLKSDSLNVTLSDVEGDLHAIRLIMALS